MRFFHHPGFFFREASESDEIYFIFDLSPSSLFYMFFVEIMQFSAESVKDDDERKKSRKQILR